MLIRAKIVGDQILPLEPIPFRDGEIVTLRVESGLYSLAQELGNLSAPEDIDTVLGENRNKKYYE
ncbi:MAG: hypothetical protein V1862_07750 [Methanobacteriota archaeon]